MLEMVRFNDRNSQRDRIFAMIGFSKRPLALRSVPMQKRRDQTTLNWNALWRCMRLWPGKIQHRISLTARGQKDTKMQLNGPNRIIGENNFQLCELFFPLREADFGVDCVRFGFLKINVDPVDFSDVHISDHKIAIIVVCEIQSVLLVFAHLCVPHADYSLYESTKNIIWLR